METFSALLAICAGSSSVPGEFPSQRPVTRSVDVFFDLPPNKRLSKQWDWSGDLRRHRAHYDVIVMGSRLIRATHSHWHWNDRSHTQCQWSNPEEYGGIHGMKQIYINGLVQEKSNSIANALELRLFCTNPSIWSQFYEFFFVTGCTESCKIDNFSRSHWRTFRKNDIHISLPNQAKPNQGITSYEHIPKDIPRTW